MELDKKTLEICLELAEEKCRYPETDFPEYRELVSKLKEALSEEEKWEARRQLFRSFWEDM